MTNTIKTGINHLIHHTHALMLDNGLVLWSRARAQVVKVMRDNGMTDHDISQVEEFLDGAEDKRMATLAMINSTVPDDDPRLALCTTDGQNEICQEIQMAERHNATIQETA